MVYTSLLLGFGLYMMDERDRTRQRSPHREHRSRGREERRDRHRDTQRRRSRSRSPGYRRSKPSRHDSDSHQSSRHGSRRPHDTSRSNVPLPFSARPLSKSDLAIFEPLFAEYLSLQKQKDIEEMDDREVKGRWKSFVGKWNRGELAEGWYDPEMFAKYAAEYEGSRRREREVDREDEDREETERREVTEVNEQEDDEDDEYGPVLPTGTSSSGRRSGPGIPTLQDLSLRAEQREDDHQASIDALRLARKADRTLQKSQLDDLTPRAEAGTHERKMENRALLNEKLRSFREKSPGMEAPDKELMGGDDTVEEYKKMKEREQRRKTEREVRREEIERAKREEMEERRRAWREREEGTVGMLRELARQRFG